MSIQLAIPDEKHITTLPWAWCIHRDDNKIIVILDTAYLTGSQEVSFETEGLFVGLNPEDDMIKTKTHIISNEDSTGGAYTPLNDHQWIIEFTL